MCSGTRTVSRFWTVKELAFQFGGKSVLGTAKGSKKGSPGGLGGPAQKDRPPPRLADFRPRGQENRPPWRGGCYVSGQRNCHSMLHRGNPDPANHLCNLALHCHVVLWRNCELSSGHSKIIRTVTHVVVRIAILHFIWILLGMYHLHRGASDDPLHRTMSFEVPHQMRISQTGSGARGRVIGPHKTTAIPALCPSRAPSLGDGNPNGAGSSESSESGS